ncbi:MAG: PHP domain-containing protein [Chloroflexi bacterium]|nr:PHP domain-containing protein [Chloroflexota bacterium]
MIKADLHVHTSASRDSMLSPEELIALCLRRGIGALAVTDHNHIAGALRLREIAPFPVIVGEEIQTTCGEIMGLFLEETVPKNLSPEETVIRIKEQGGLVIIPHPFDRVRRSVLRRDALYAILDQVDGIEVFNARVTLPNDNIRARALAEERGLLQTAGSDGHIACEIGNAWVEMPEFEDKEGFLHALAQGRVHGSLTNPFIHVIGTWVKWHKRLKGKQSVL